MIHKDGSKSIWVPEANSTQMEVKQIQLFVAFLGIQSGEYIPTDYLPTGQYARCAEPTEGTTDWNLYIVIGVLVLVMFVVIPVAVWYYRKYKKLKKLPSPTTTPDTPTLRAESTGRKINFNVSGFSARRPDLNKFDGRPLRSHSVARKAPPALSWVL
jgi:hypothetical protein